MCGICGVVRFGGIREEDRDAARQMTTMLRHRGPDGDGLWSADEIALGHARLAIIDFAGGHQPMLSDDGHVAVTFNGEIYNYQLLRARLIDLGHQFRTRSDTEVILRGFQQWGAAVVHELRGMFAFAVWSARERQLLLARDRLGEKPFYYAVPPGDTDAFVFASEIKAVVAHPATRRAINAPRLAEYLAFRSLAGDESLFDGVKVLPPGTMMLLRPGHRELRRYWSNDDAPPPSLRDRGRDTGERLLRDAVACRLMSDVGVGSVMSGGLDSSLVSAIATQEAGRPLDTFCVGFANAAFDERPFARAVAERIGSRHHELVLQPEEVARELLPLTWAHDEPLTHPNSIPMHLIFRHAKEQAGVTVLLSGEGADEVFGGYDWYRTARWRSRLARLGGIANLLPSLAGGKGAGLRRILATDYLLEANAFTPLATAEALAGGRALSSERRALWPADRDPLDALFLFDQRTYLVPLLQRQDRMSMAAGVEARVVFLDHDLVAWANAIPSADKLRGGERKALLKEIAGSWIPDGVVRRPKVGFTLPLAGWLRTLPALRERVEGLRDSGARVRGYLDASAVDRAVRDFLSGDDGQSDLVWTILALEAWMETFLGPALRPVELPGARNGRRGANA